MQNTKFNYAKEIIKIIVVVPVVIVSHLVGLLIQFSKDVWKFDWSLRRRVTVLAALWGLLSFGTISVVSANTQDILRKSVANIDGSIGNCVGPDGKRFWLGQEECNSFNTAWATPTPQTTQVATPALTDTPEPTAAPQPTSPAEPTSTVIPTQKVYPTKVYVSPTKKYVPPTVVPPTNAPVQQFTAPVSGGGGGGDRDCGDFGSHAEAQSFFVANGGPGSDPHRLDADHDGIACETLP